MLGLNGVKNVTITTKVWINGHIILGSVNETLSILIYSAIVPETNYTTKESF